MNALRPLLALFALTGLALPLQSFAHCQVPCGIYGDATVFATLHEHAATVEKAMTEITKLAGAHDAQSAQQVARWVANKESHATKIQDVCQQYFLAQRIKFPKAGEEKAYAQKLQLLHEIIVHAMKCKQSVDTSEVAKLRASLSVFQAVYSGKE